MTRFQLLLLLVATSLACQAPRAAQRTVPVDDEPYPIVLVHGISGFREMAGIPYFVGVAERLRAEGHRVLVAELSPWATVAVRAEQLAAQVDVFRRQTGAARVHVVAHSMGGLDARHAITRLGLGPVVASLTTMGTPHRGSPVADAWYAAHVRPADGLRNVSADVWAAVARGPDQPSDTSGAVHDLTTHGMAQFNRDVPDHPQVRYYSFAGRTLTEGASACDDGVYPNPRAIDLPPPELVATTNLLIHDVSDGYVPVWSARWGTFMGCVPANHYRLVGHLAGFVELPGVWDHRAFYAAWAEELVSGRAARLARSATTW
ncbi:MAG: alpha/beta fold hydrolase [Myxococcota bacterium]